MKFIYKIRGSFSKILIDFSPLSTFCNKKRIKIDLKMNEKGCVYDKVSFDVHWNRLTSYMFNPINW